MKFLIWIVVGFALMALSVPYEFYQESYQYSDGSLLAGLIFFAGVLIVFLTFCSFVKGLLKPRSGAISKGVIE